MSWQYKIIKTSIFGTDPFGAGELSDKTRTSPYGNMGGDSVYGLREPSSGKGHPNDYFSESKNNDNLEKKLEDEKEKKLILKFRKNKKKKIKKAQLNQVMAENPFKTALSKSVTIESVDEAKSEIGSGFFISSTVILTCAHVALPSGEGKKSQIKVHYNDQFYTGRVWAFDETIDLAAVTIDDEGFVCDSYFVLGNPEDIQQGNDIIIVGTPLGFENLISDGIISSGASVSIEEGRSPYFFVTADISPGNSGGPVVDKNTGKLIGIAAAIVSRENQTSGLSAAIPIDIIKRFLEENGIKY